MNVSPHDPRWQDLLPVFALEALEGEDRRQLEEHLASGCATCRAELEELKRDLAVLAEAVSSVEPSPEIRQRLMDQLPGQSPKIVPFGSRLNTAAAPSATDDSIAAPSSGLLSVGLWRGLAMAAALTGVLLGLATFWQQRELGAVRYERDRLVGQLERNHGQLEELRSEAKALASEVSALTSRQARQVVLAGLEEAPGAKALAYVDEVQSTARFYAFDLPATPSGHEYQLWVISAGVPASAGVFTVEEDGSARVEISALPAERPIDAWAVTIEPSGGVPQPTGPMVLLSS
ncbi:MAG: anti-sigma factor [Thermoanaerobaculia bacterium]|nr:anti-sigma factor [Thermoanaerobaculia bacterium]